MELRQRKVFTFWSNISKCPVLVNDRNSCWKLGQEGKGCVLCIQGVPPDHSEGLNITRFSRVGCSLCELEILRKHMVWSLGFLKSHLHLCVLPSLKSSPPLALLTCSSCSHQRLRLEGTTLASLQIPLAWHARIPPC